MTRPRTVKDKLIFLASSSVPPVAPDFEIFSDPARSAMFSFETRTEPERDLLARGMDAQCENVERPAPWPGGRLLL